MYRMVLYVSRTCWQPFALRTFCCSILNIKWHLGSNFNCCPRLSGFKFVIPLTLNLLTWRIWWSSNNVSKGQMGFNSAFKGLNTLMTAYCAVADTAGLNLWCLRHHHHHQILLLLVEHRASMKSFQALRSPAIPLTYFHDLLVLLILSYIVVRHFLFGLPLLLYPSGFQSNAVFSVTPVSLRNVCPIKFHFLLFIWFSIDFW